MATILDSIKHEYALTTEQAIFFDEYVHQRWGYNMWVHADGPNDESFYIQMANEAAHAAYTLEQVAQAMWQLDVRSIYNELVEDEVREIVAMA